MTLSLLLETGTEKGCIALFDRHQPLYSAHLPFGLQNSQALMPAVQQGLKAIGKDCSELSYISVGVGPGSYTGIRVAAIVGKTLAYALNIPLVCFSTLNSFIPSSPGKFSAAIDAKIGGVYLLVGEVCAGKVAYSGKPGIFSLGEASAYLQKEEVLHMATPHASALIEKWKALKLPCQWEWQDLSPDISHLGCLTWKQFKWGDVADSSSVELLYLRKTQAEIEKENVPC